MPRSVKLFDMGNHENLPLTQEPLPFLPTISESIAALAHMHFHLDDDTSATTTRFSAFLNGPSTFAPAPLYDDVNKVQYFSGKVKYKGEVIRATKDLFLVSPDTYPDIPPDLYLNGVILSVPWGGRQEFDGMWDVQTAWYEG